jgi:uncharacterized protein with PIN domain
VEEVVQALDLGKNLCPYGSCMMCNGRLSLVDRFDAARDLPLQVFLVYRDFTRCDDCGRVYWSGSHQRRLDQVIERARAAA